MLFGRGSENLSISTAQRFRINLSWLLKLRWFAVAGQLVTVFGANRILGLEMPLNLLLPIIGVGALTNAGLELLSRAWLARTYRIVGGGEQILVSILFLDLLLLSSLLLVSGGPANPFSIFYLINIALASTLLPQAWAWSLNTLAILCFFSLFFINLPLEGLRDPMPFPGRTEADFTSVGTLVAVSGAATILVYFVTRIKAELAQRESELAQQRQRKARMEKFEALATLAGGAAHELATPLSTIAVISRELELGLERQAPLDGIAEDAKLIRREVDSCRAILDQMSLDAGESVGEEIVRVELATLLTWVTRPLRESERVDVRFDGRAGEFQVAIPKRAVTRAIRSVVKNGLDASAASARVDVEVSVDGKFLVIVVTDAGIGMDELTMAKASEPFFTTKDTGAGMGLGLFLARSVVDRLEGSIEFCSTPGKGTTVTLRLPIVAAAPPTGPDDAQVV